MPIEQITEVITVVPAPATIHDPVTSQSPAVRVAVAVFVFVAVVMPIADEVLVITCPTTPAPAFTPLVTPLIVGVVIIGDADTKAVVASCVVLVPAAVVGAAGVPVNVGEANKA